MRQTMLWSLFLTLLEKWKIVLPSSAVWNSPICSAALALLLRALVYFPFRLIASVQFSMTFLGSFYNKNNNIGVGNGQPIYFFVRELWRAAIMHKNIIIINETTSITIYDVKKEFLNRDLITKIEFWNNTKDNILNLFLIYMINGLWFDQ